MTKNHRATNHILFATWFLTLALVFGLTPGAKAQTKADTKSKPVSWATFDFSEAEFVRRFNALAKDFKMRPITKKSASANKVATTTIYAGLDEDQRIVVTTPVGHRYVKVVNIHSPLDRKFEPAARFILCMLVTIAATDPTATPEDRHAVLRDLGVVRTKNEAHLPADKGEVKRGKITYYFVVVEDTMQFTVSVDG